MNVETETMKTIAKAAFSIALLLVPMLASGTEGDERGLEIMREVDRRGVGFEDMSAELEMILKNKQGQESSRRLHVRTLEVEKDGDKSLVIFNQPLDVRGTALLTHTHKHKDDDRWLYLPAIKRVKRISSANKSGPFMGSEFSYEDLASQEVEKYNYEYVREEQCVNMPCYVVDRYPVDPHSGYKKQRLWIDKAEYRIMKIDYYDRKDSLLKTLTMSDYKLFLGRYWRAQHMYMENHQTGKTTALRWSGYQFKNGFDRRNFEQRALARVL